MNIVSKKLHALEKNVLPELPEEGTTKITWENSDIDLDRAENELHRRAAQILEAHAQEIQKAAEFGETAYNPLSPSDQEIVDASSRRFMARILEIFQVFIDAFVTYEDPMSNWVFYTRFYWIIEETRKFKEQYDAEEAVFKMPGYWDLCEGEQEKRLAHVYATWNHDLFSPESFQRYCEEHHVFKTTEDIQHIIANRTPSKQGKTSYKNNKKNMRKKKSSRETNGTLKRNARRAQSRAAGLRIMSELSKLTNYRGVKASWKKKFLFLCRKR